MVIAVNSRSSSEGGYWPPKRCVEMSSIAIDGLFIRKAKPCRDYIREPRPRVSLEALSQLCDYGGSDVPAFNFTRFTSAELMAPLAVTSEFAPGPINCVVPLLISVNVPLVLVMKT